MSNSEEVELLPCAHCGGEAKILNTICDVAISCSECRINIVKRHQNAKGETYATDLAVKAWNTRTLILDNKHDWYTYSFHRHCHKCGRQESLNTDHKIINEGDRSC